MSLQKSFHYTSKSSDILYKPIPESQYEKRITPSQAVFANKSKNTDVRKLSAATLQVVNGMVLP